MKKNHKSVKGMTLVEIIISVFVFSVTALILVNVGGTINSLSKNASHVNKKTNLESPVIENGLSYLDIQLVTDAATEGGTRDRSLDKETVTLKGNATNSIQPVQGNVKVSMTYNDHAVELTAKSFTAAPRADAKDDASTGGDLQYIYISKALTSKSNNWVDIDAPKDDESSGSGGTGGSSGSGSENSGNNDNQGEQ